LACRDFAAEFVATPAENGSMLTKQEIRKAAEELNRAEKTRKQIRMISLQYPQMTIGDAYEIQKSWIELKTAEGRVVKGHKVGLTSKAMQAAVGIQEPDFGVLLDDMFFDDGGRVPDDRFIGLRVETEIAFILRTPLSGPGCTVADVINATDFVLPAIEILDTRIFRVDPETKATRKVLDTIADNAANAGVILGAKRFGPRDQDLRWVSAVCSRNGEIEETGVAAGVLNDPANSVAWLVNRLGQFGERLQAGEVIMSGSFIRPVEVKKGDRVLADFGTFGTVSCDFV
jgi:2-oxo-hept-3-ene-1,7-dioate hydratase